MTNRNRVEPAQNLCHVERPDILPSRRQALQALGQVVYAARLDTGEIKFGCTTDLAQRLASLQTYNGCGVTLLAFRPGDFSDEAAVHERLIDHRAHGREYYCPSPPVLALVNEMRAALGLETIAA